MWVRPPPSVHFSEAYIAIGMGIKVDIEKAKQIIFNNSQAGENSFVFDLHERQVFTEKLFWEYYDSIAALVTADDEKTLELTRLITDNYQVILKYIIYHFNPRDAYHMKSFPKNYLDYIERLDYVLMAYHTGNSELISDDRFELQR